MFLVISSGHFVRSDRTEVIRLMLVASETVKLYTNDANFSLANALLFRSFSKEALDKFEGCVQKQNEA